MPRRRNRRRRGPWIYIDEIALNIRGAGSVQYKTSDVRFNQERAYKVVSCTAFVTGPGVVNLKIKDPEEPHTNDSAFGTIASSGLRTVGASVVRVFVRNKSGTYFTCPCEDIQTLVEITCIQGVAIGCLKIVLQLDCEVSREPSRVLIWPLEDHGDDGQQPFERLI